MKPSNIKQIITFDKVRPLAMDSFDTKPTVEFFDRLGVSVDEADPHIKYIMAEGLAKNKSYAGDAMPTVTEPSVVTAAQFIQFWMPKAVEVITQARMADKLFGRTLGGSWEDEEFVQPIVEYTGRVGVYGDHTDAPLADFNQTLEKRTIIRFEEALLSGKLEDARTAASNLRKSAHDLKRAAVAKAFAIAQNEVAFYGFNNGQNLTFGALNDKNMLPYVNTTTSGWASATYAQLVKELNTMISTLRAQSGDNVDMQDEKMTLAIASSRVDYLGTANEHGETVGDWLQRKHKNIRIVSVPEFDGAYGGTNVAYLYFEQLEGSKVFHQLIASTMRLLGVEIRAKGLHEDYTNALAGTLCAQPLGCVRFAGI
jgi:hypothetical protein